MKIKDFQKLVELLLKFDFVQNQIPKAIKNSQAFGLACFFFCRSGFALTRYTHAGLLFQGESPVNDCNY